MQKERSRKLINLSLLVILSLPLLIATITLVSAAPLTDPIKDLFAFTGDSAISVNIAKYLFWILLTLLVWSALDAGNVVRNNGIRWIISIVVGFLGVAYLTPNEIWLTLISYGALGMTLLYIFPTLILMFFTFRVVREGQATGIVLQYAMWIIYSCFLAYRFIQGIITGDLDTTETSTWVFLGVIIITVFVVIANKWLRKRLGDEFISEEITAAESVERLAAAVTGARATTAVQQSEGRARRPRR